MGFASKIKAALFPEEQKEGEPPPWVGRLKEARYSSLSGKAFSFLFLDLSMFVEIKSTVFKSVDGDGVYVQSNGIGMVRYPMLMVLTGGDNDKLAQHAMGALLESGVGTLYHPIVGPVDVGITGEIEQINKFITEANQTSIVCEFIETTGLLIDDLPPFPSALKAFLDKAAGDFADSVVLDEYHDKVSMIEKVKKAIATVHRVNSALSDGVASVQSKVDDTFDSINNAIDVLIKEPLMLALQVQNLIMTPARELSIIKDKLEAYKNMANDIFGKTSKASGYDFGSINEFALDSLISATSTAALITSGFNGTQRRTGTDSAPVYKRDLVKAQADIIDTIDGLSTWSDDNATTLGLTNNAGGFGELVDVAKIAIATITSEISRAKTEIRFTTSYERPAMGWCYELYRSVKPDMLTYFQITNDLGGDEILMIPAGRELVYYV